MYSRVYILQLNFGLSNSHYRWLWDRLLVTGKNMVVYSENTGIESNIHNITWKSIFGRLVALYIGEWQAPEMARVYKIWPKGMFSVLVPLLTLLTISEANAGWVDHAVMGGPCGHGWAMWSRVSKCLGLKGTSGGSSWKRTFYWLFERLLAPFTCRIYFYLLLLTFY